MFNHEIDDRPYCSRSHFPRSCFPLLPRALIAGGGAPEIEVALRLMEYSQTLSGMEAYCVRAFAEAMEVIPYTLAENAGLNPISVVTELRNRHARGEPNTGINVRKVRPRRHVHMCTTMTTVIWLYFALKIFRTLLFRTV